MTKETKYLFTKMNDVEDGIEKSIRLEEKTELPEVTKASSTVYRFDESDKKSGKWKTYREWIAENVMLLSTLGAVIIGVTSGLCLVMNFKLNYGKKNLWKKAV